MWDPVEKEELGWIKMLKTRLYALPVCLLWQLLCWASAGMWDVAGGGGTSCVESSADPTQHKMLGWEHKTPVFLFPWAPH